MFRGPLPACPSDGAALLPLPRDPQLGVFVADRFAIEAVLGEAALGRVYRARCARTGGAFVVQLMYGEYAALPPYAELFAEHLQRCAPLRGLHLLVPVAAGVTEAGVPYLVTPRVAGTRLSDVIRREAPLHPRLALALARAIAGALGELHAHRLIHGDLTAEHVIVVEHTSRCVVELARPGNSSATPPYRAPEHDAGCAADPRADLYALGVVLYELLSGAAPFRGTPAAQAIAAAMRAAPRLPDEVPAQAQDIALRLLERDPMRRYQSADELALAIDGARI